MTNTILHYVYDPLCGWCYAAEPLVKAAADACVPIVLHGGGLWDPGVHAPEAKRRSMRETDARIARLTGQLFGEAYLEGLLVDPREHLVVAPDRRRRARGPRAWRPAGAWP